MNKLIMTLLSLSLTFCFSALGQGPDEMPPPPNMDEMPQGFDRGGPGPDDDSPRFGRQKRFKQHGRMGKRRGFRGQKRMGRRGGPGKIERHLFPPQIIMRKQAELELTSDQEKKIIKIMSSFQSEIVQLKWSLKKEEEKLEKLVSGNKVDPKAANSQISKVLSAEGALKSKHLGMLIEVKNTLTEKQIDLLGKLARRRGRGPGPGPGPGPDFDQGPE